MKIPLSYESNFLVSVTPVVRREAVEAVTILISPPTGIPTTGPDAAITVSDITGNELRIAYPPVNPGSCSVVTVPL
jgi:hypothetical protein